MENRNYDEKGHICGLVKEIKVVNASDYEIELFFTEREKDEMGTDETSLTVDAHEEEDKSLTVLGFGDGKQITKIRYAIKSVEEESEPHDVLLTWEHPSHEVKIDMGSNINPKVKFDIREDASDVDNKVLLVGIKNA